MITLKELLATANGNVDLPIVAVNTDKGIVDYVAKVKTAEIKNGTEKVLVISL